MNDCTKKEKTILTCLNTIVKTVGYGNTAPDGGVPESIQEEAEYVAGKFHIEPVQSILLAVITESSGFGSVTAEVSVVCIEDLFSRMRAEFSEYFDGALDGNWLSGNLHGLIDGNREESNSRCLFILRGCTDF